MQDDVVFSESGITLYACIKCEIDHHTARRIREKIDNALFETKPQVLIIDFSEVKFMDSSGLALILGRLDTASAIGAVVRLSGLSEPLMKLVRLAGLDRIKNLTFIK